MTAAEAEAILGKPTVSSGDRLIYSITAHRNISPEVFNKLRKQNPQMSPSQFQKNFSQYDLSIYIEARFSFGQMTYLAVSEGAA